MDYHILGYNISMMYIALKYALFAGIATVSNIGTQYFCLLKYHGPFNLYIAMAVGTIVGLGVKYILDKNFIFYHPCPYPGFYLPAMGT